jgi:hypothetical protein
MIAIGRKALADVRRRPIPVANDTFHKGEWMETGTDPRLSPTVFLAEQPPDCELLTHFHRQNQFQLFVDGTGTIGREQIGPVTVHYAGAYTGYGPLLSGPAGLKYFTIRSVFDTGFIPATEAREKMVRGPKRHAQARLGEPWSVERLSALHAPQVQWALPEDMGLGAVHVRLPAGAAFVLEAIHDSHGQFVFVLAGSAAVQGAELAPWESAFATADERDVSVVAGTQGAELVVLHMPVTQPEYAPVSGEAALS